MIELNNIHSELFCEIDILFHACPIAEKKGSSYIMLTQIFMVSKINHQW